MVYASPECARMRLVMASQWPDSPAGRLLEKLETHYGTPKPSALTGPFEMILWEIVAYLSDDNRRGMAFEQLRKKVGLTPAQILAAPLKTLRAITREGGAIAADERAERLQRAAQIASDKFSGDLTSVLKLPPQKSKKALMQFPMIGEPGAEKILLFSGVLGVLALESNGVRVLVRVGIGQEGKSYAATYRSIREATLEQLPQDSRLLTTAHLLLRRHGQELCSRNGPACGSCPVRLECRLGKHYGV
jgi:endonuclease-3